MRPEVLDQPHAGASFSFLEAYPDAIAIHRLGEILFVNEAGLRLVGAESADVVLGRNVLEFVHPDSRGPVLERMRQTASGVMAGLLDEQFIRLDGATIDVQVVALPIGLEDGPATQLIVRDVTAQRALERQAAEHGFTQEALDLAERAAGLGVWDWRVGSEDLRWTKGLEPLHGMAPGTFRGTFEHFLEAVHADDRPGLLAAIDAALASGGNDDFEARMRIGGLEDERWILGKGRVFRDASGEPTRMVGIGLDVTARTRVEMELAEQQAFLRLVTGLLPANVAYFDTEERYRFVNDTYGTWFGVDPASVLGHTAREFMGKKAYSICEPHLKRALAGEPAELRMDIFNPSGGRRYLHAQYVPDRRTDGSVRGVVALINDVTALHQATESLEAALAARDDFVAFTTHELKTPLTVILGLANVLARRAGELAAEDLREVGASMEREARRLEDTVENMLLLARAERGDADEPALLHRCVEQLLGSRAWQPTARRWKFEVNGAPGVTLAPAGWLQHLVENLVSNAEKYSPPETEIEVTVRERGNSVELTVSDRGRGITEEDSERLFEPFFRSRPEEAGVPGIGLGLTVCRKLVQRLGGEIWLRPRPGGGTEAGFRLPVVLENHARGDERDEGAGNGR